MPPRARSSLCGYARGARDVPATTATRPPDGGDTNSAPSGDLFASGPSRNCLSNPGRGHDGASNPKRFPAEHPGKFAGGSAVERPARSGPRAPAQSTRTQYLQQYPSCSTPGVIRDAHQAKSGTASVTSAEVPVFCPAALPFCRCGTPRNKVTLVFSGFSMRAASSFSGQALPKLTSKSRSRMTGSVLNLFFGLVMPQ